MTMQRPYFRFVFFIASVLLLAGMIGLVACAKPPVVSPVPASSPEPLPTSAPSAQPVEDTRELAETPGIPHALPHHYWGQVTVSTGEPAIDVEVTAWINGELRGSATTDAEGQYGVDPLVGLPYYLVVTGQSGNVIEFRVDGVVAEETRLGVLEEDNEKYFWQWQDLRTEWQAIYDAGAVNGLDLVYTTAR